MNPPTIIPQSVLDQGYDQQVHVLGWNPACTFLYRGTDRYGNHQLVTPRTRRPCTTRNPLTYTERNLPSSAPLIAVLLRFAAGCAYETTDRHNAAEMPSRPANPPTHITK